MLKSTLYTIISMALFAGCSNGFLSGKCSKEDTAYTRGYNILAEDKNTNWDWVKSSPAAISGSAQGACQVIVAYDSEAENLFPICQKGFFDAIAGKKPEIDLCPSEKCDPLMDKLQGMK